MRRWWSKARRWARWAASGALSAATPLPWLVDVTSARFDALEDRVAKLERGRMVMVTGETPGARWVME